MAHCLVTPYSSLTTSCPLHRLITKFRFSHHTCGNVCGISPRQLLHCTQMYLFIASFHNISLVVHSEFPLSHISIAATHDLPQGGVSYQQSHTYIDLAKNIVGKIIRDLILVDMAKTTMAVRAVSQSPIISQHNISLFRAGVEILGGPPSSYCFPLISQVSQCSP